MNEAIRNYCDGRISIDPDISAGETHEEILKQYPSLMADDIAACFAFAIGNQ